jgi:hypothetical protein
METPRKIVTVCFPLFYTVATGAAALFLGRKKDTPGARKLCMVGLWNGGGGKFKPGVDLSVAHCHQRETEEDFGITLLLESIIPAGIVLVRNPGEVEDIELHFAFATRWSGEFVPESREMAENHWHSLWQMPYEEMMDMDKRLELPKRLFEAYQHRKILRTRIVHQIGPEGRFIVESFDPIIVEEVPALQT